MFGGPGRDLLSGGNGNDLYFMQGGGLDRIVEVAGGGTDIVVTNARTYTLPKNLEHLQFDGMFGPATADSHGIGNQAGNWISGGNGADTLEGLGGNDTLSGAGGHDVLVGGAGRDSFQFGAGGNFVGNSLIGRHSDQVQDFDVALDSFLLNGFLFAEPWRSPADGAMKAGQFGLAGGALTGKELVIYDPATGELSTTSHAGTIGVFAVVTPGLALTFHDFEWGIF
jgi:Ca2+-binding RTX toxin-like protein